MQPTPLKCEINAMELLEWALETGDEDCAATQIAGESVPIAIRRKALELLETGKTLSCQDRLGMTDAGHD